MDLNSVLVPEECSRFLQNKHNVSHSEGRKTMKYLERKTMKDCEIFHPETMKYWVGVQWGQSDLMGRRCLFSLGWQPF